MLGTRSFFYREYVTTTSILELDSNKMIRIELSFQKKCYYIESIV